MAPTTDDSDGTVRVEGDYYLYALVDPQAFLETNDELLSVFYVGKGRRQRWQHHEKEVRRDLAREQERLERHGSKAQRIRMILERGGTVPVIRLSAGYKEEQDAYYAESLAIDTINALLRAAGRATLTNATPGHHAGFVWLKEHFAYTEIVEREASRPASGAAPLTILVKGTTEDLVEHAQQVATPGDLPDALRGRPRITGIRIVRGSQPTRTRRGWNPLDPWTDAEARERARRFWPLAKDKVTSWLDDPTSTPRTLLLGIPDAGTQQTVVRYAWEIDQDGRWEYYIDSARWGIPLGRRLHEHPDLGVALYEDRDGKRVQVLLNYSSGIRLLNDR